MKEVITICQDIADLCKRNESEDWAGCFYLFVDKLENEEWSIVKRKIISVYGGMGSFNDLVLHRNCVPLWKENDELQRLRSKLYKAVTDNW
jgi:hypothetical protein